MCRYARLQLMACLTICLCLLMGCSAAKPGQSHRADVVVYGDASGGVVAAVAAKQQGKEVILVSQS